MATLIQDGTVYSVHNLYTEDVDFLINSGQPLFFDGASFFLLSPAEDEKTALKRTGCAGILTEKRDPYGEWVWLRPVKTLIHFLISIGEPFILTPNALFTKESALTTSLRYHMAYRSYVVMWK
ncbi:hypothetical protein [uncultured Thermosynechococcus sp.]|uniref:hypothetical protein n=1 Tax=uncultured Thermosynechococcus sp. TaxID=436945 RepID=UPI0026380B6A|nr:hypothetical protein [uncultured Thermosynechococcus sp.]